jgi:hypothetical protein
VRAELGGDRFRPHSIAVNHRRQLKLAGDSGLLPLVRQFAIDARMIPAKRTNPNDRNAE